MPLFPGVFALIWVAAPPPGHLGPRPASLRCLRCSAVFRVRRPAALEPWRAGFHRRGWRLSKAVGGGPPSRPLLALIPHPFFVDRIDPGPYGQNRHFQSVPVRRVAY